MQKYTTDKDSLRGTVVGEAVGLLMGRYTFKSLLQVQRHSQDNFGLVTLSHFQSVPTLSS